MDYKKFFEKRNIEYQEGLNEKEISHIEEIYDIFFPTELKEVLEQVLPVEKGFYNWRDFSKENIQYFSFQKIFYNPYSFPFLFDFRE